MPSAHPFTPDLADPRSQRWGDAATGIVCDPQGLTCYTRGQISQQWRWAELARIVALDSQAALGIITRAGDKQRYSNHRLSAADYADIARCAAAWAASEELNCDAADLLPIIENLCALARRIENGQQLYFITA